VIAHRRRAGLTLIEVLVAMVLCGAGLTIVCTSLSAAVRAEGAAGDLERAARHLDLLLARLEGGALDLSAAEGDFADDGAEDLRWTVEIENTDIEGLQEAELTVLWDRPNGEQSLVVRRQFFVDPLQGGLQ
jgi:prepilin-type N-terminal cleavage/methylation domain-containing protein